MARSCGIHIDQSHFHLVALEGSAKKARVIATGSGVIAPGENPVTEVASALKRLVKEHSIRAENVGLAVDSGLAAFRNLTVPFDDRAKIEDIIKFEVESDLPQWSIDDVIVDFLVLSTRPGVESHLLVTALPRERLEPQLAACERGGLEATTSELDGTALYHAAEAAGLFSEDAAQVLVHVGDSSTTVVVVDGGRLKSIRAIRAGAAPHTKDVLALPPASVPGEPNGDGAQPEAQFEAPDVVEARSSRSALRIRRELGRTVSGAMTEHPIEAIYLCGRALEGLDEESLFDVPVHPLLLGGDAEGIEPEFAVAYGAALRSMGAGSLTPELRRDDLRYTGKFERLELPLAVLSLLICTLLGVKLIVTLKQLEWRDTGSDIVNSPGDMQLWAQSVVDYLLPNPETGWPGRLKDPSDGVKKWIAAIETDSDPTRTKYEQLKEFKRILGDEVNALKKRVGVDTTSFPRPQSALHGFLLVMNVIEGMGDRVGRFGLRFVEANYRQGRRNTSDAVEIRLDMDFFAEDGVAASRNYAAMREAMRSQPWCLDFPERPSRPFPEGGGISFDGLTITVDVEKALEAEDAAS